MAVCARCLCILDALYLFAYCNVNSLFSGALWTAQLTASGDVVMNSELQRLWKEADVHGFTQSPVQLVPANSWGLSGWGVALTTHPI